MATALMRRPREPTRSFVGGASAPTLFAQVSAQQRSGWPKSVGAEAPAIKDLETSHPPALCRDCIT
ncbi:DUF6053 domain-containing protein [Lysobacter capsici]|uniref:DUF6053 domain-containing protein n=1 Tax=Lysobacter capsici TaxID=435897 RepID=UPI003CCD830F